LGLFSGSRHGAPVDTENADTEEVPRKVCESTNPEPVGIHARKDQSSLAVAFP
jgi:hypothetical protein